MCPRHFTAQVERAGRQAGEEGSVCEGKERREEMVTAPLPYTRGPQMHTRTHTHTDPNALLANVHLSNPIVSHSIG